MKEKKKEAEAERKVPPRVAVFPLLRPALGPVW